MALIPTSHHVYFIPPSEFTCKTQQRRSYIDEAERIALLLSTAWSTSRL